MGWMWIVVLGGMPVLLTATAFTRYIVVSRSLGRKLAVIRTGVLLVVLSTASWLFIFALMMLQDRSTQIKAVASDVSPVPVGLVNLLFSVGAIICSRLGHRDEQTRSARTALIVAGAFLCILWLFVSANPH